MFQFFNKKIYIKDHLEGFIDIHCHILPGIDDGASNIEESIELIKKYSILGIDHFIATPHIMEDYYPNDDISIANAFEKLQDALNTARLSHVIINPSAEYMIDANFESLLEQKNIHPLKEKYVLIEMSYLQPPINLESVIHRVRNQGFFPVLAHPERYTYYTNKKAAYKWLKQLGCFFQMNLLSLSEYYGRTVQKAANYLLEENLIDFVATDTHKMSQLERISELSVNQKIFSNIKTAIQTTNDTFYP